MSILFLSLCELCENALYQSMTLPWVVWHTFSGWNNQMSPRLWRNLGKTSISILYSATWWTHEFIRLALVIWVKNCDRRDNTKAKESSKAHWIMDEDSWKLETWRSVNDFVGVLTDLRMSQAAQLLSAIRLRWLLSLFNLWKEGALGFW